MPVDEAHCTGTLAMAELKSKIKQALDECRILVLGAQVLIGFQFQAAFEPGFPALRHGSQVFLLVSLALMLTSLVLLIAPAGFHCIAERGEDTPRLHRYVTCVSGLALLPFAVGLAAAIYAAVEHLGGGPGGCAAAAAVTAALALFMWYGLEAIARYLGEGRERRDGSAHPEEKPMDPEADCKPQGKPERKTELKDRIEQVLTESRVVLPGAQALFGFQFTVILMEAFAKLPPYARAIHLCCLALVAVSIMLLMAPPAYHRIVESGEDSERFHQIASALVLAAMLPLTFGACGDFFVFALKVTGSPAFSAAGAALLTALFLVLWYGYPLYRRWRDRGALVLPAQAGATPGR